tara:strand:+ start:287 stop:2518 length:2232 start_codon:yes stop_codon:yes gene_type:complete
MFKKFYTILFIFIYFSISKAEIVNQVKIDGNKRVSSETILLYGEIEKNKDLSENDLNKILNNLYSTNFFEDVKVDLKNNVLRITVQEYPVINQLIITGEKKNSTIDQIKKIIYLKEKKSFIRSYLSNDIELIKSLYASQGYNFAKIDAKINKIDEENLELLIEISRGEKTEISSINFIGNKTFRSKRLRDVIASEEDKFWKFISRNTVLNENLINLDKRLLLNYYKSNGFYDAKISSNIAELSKEGSVNLVYTIDEGKRYRINKISTKIDKVFDKKIFFPLNDVYREYIGEYYSPFKVKKLLEEIDLLIDENNLQFIEHNVQEIVNNDTIDIIFNIFEGEKNLIERINITGNNTTSENVIRGELLLDEGDPLTNLNLEKSIAEIKERRIFGEVKYNVKDGSQKNLKIIDIEVEEKPTGEISAGAGIGTSGGNLAFNIQENNWMGQGKKLGFEIQLDQESIAGEFSYNDPNYDFLGNSIFYALSSEKNDKPNQGYENSIVSGSIGTSFEQYRNVKVNLGLSASYDDLSTDSSASSSLKKQAGEFEEISANYGFTFDKRDRVFMPTSGSVISFRQNLPAYADKKFIGNTFSASKYKSLGENIVGATKFYLSAVNGIGEDDVRLSKRRSLSSRRLRGFEHNKIGPVDGSDHVGGNYSAALNFETNLPNVLPENTNADVGLFLDIGNVWGVDYDSSIDDSNEIRSSTGIKLDWLSPLGPMNFVLSQDLSKADTDVTESFSFNLGTTF